MAACAPTQRLEVLAFLLEDKKLDKELVNARGMTALHQAAWYGQNEAIEMLLRAGVSLDSTTPEGHSAMDIAKLMGHESTSRLLEVAKQEAVKALAETPEQLRQRLKQQHSTNVQRRIVQLQKSLASMTRRPPANVISTSKDKSPTPLKECNEVKKEHTLHQEVLQHVDIDHEVVSNQRAVSAKEKLHAYENEGQSFFLTQEDKNWRPISGRPR
mmetsp:Transcript_5566/g.19565  ORF Transcript_5566/g.19565 Transcript_5566/m.19565 type:complete len:214 (-) Transcript_5566:1089-1730(-)